MVHQSVIFKNNKFLLRERIRVWPTSLLSHRGQLSDPNGGSGQLRTFMLLTGSRFFKEIWNACLMRLWSWLTVSRLFTPFCHPQRRQCVTTHQVGGQVGSKEIHGVIGCQFLEAPADVAPQRRSLISSIPRRPEDGLQSPVSGHKPFTQTKGG